MGMHGHSLGPGGLHVLVVDEDLEVLAETARRLVRAGFEVSTRRSPEQLVQSIALLRPDLVLLEPLLRGLSEDQLFLLLARAQCGRSLSVILHTKLALPMLRLIVNLDEVLGVIKKPASEAAFASALENLAARHAELVGSHAQAPWSSGTHPVGSREGGPKNVPRGLRRVR